MKKYGLNQYPIIISNDETENFISDTLKLSNNRISQSKVSKLSELEKSCSKIQVIHPSLYKEFEISDTEKVVEYQFILMK